MPRAERLLELAEMLRGRDTTAVSDLAAELGVSRRTLEARALRSLRSRVVAGCPKARKSEQPDLMVGGAFRSTGSIMRPQMPALPRPKMVRSRSQPISTRRPP
jgi:predicted DNA-binding transcriptional regulator YafY